MSAKEKLLEAIRKLQENQKNLDRAIWIDRGDRLVFFTDLVDIKRAISGDLSVRKIEKVRKNGKIKYVVKEEKVKITDKEAEILLQNLQFCFPNVDFK